MYVLIEAARRASQKNLSLSEESLQEYQRLRAQANTQAVAERQSLQSLGREEKTSARTLAALQELFGGLEEAKAKLEGEIGDVDEKKGEVSDLKSRALVCEVLTGLLLGGKKGYYSPGRPREGEARTE